MLNSDITGLPYTESGRSQLYAVPVLMNDYVHVDGRSVNEGMTALSDYSDAA